MEGTVPIQAGHCLRSWTEHRMSLHLALETHVGEILVCGAGSSAFALVPPPDESNGLERYDAAAILGE